MRDSQNWKWISDSEDGIGKVLMPSWSSFVDFIHNEMLDFDDYIWRGQRQESWPLISKFERLVADARVKKAKQYDFRNHHLEKFKYAVRGRRGNSPVKLETDNDWWALGQHYGLATPLLDWSQSPFVAAFFAFEEVGTKQTKHRAIYALQHKSVEHRAGTEMARKNRERAAAKKKREASEVELGLLGMLTEAPVTSPEVEFIRPLSDENQRLVNQGGLFSSGPSNGSLEKWLKETHNNPQEGYILIKILIPNDEREQCLKALNRMNINHLTLFPDISGASKYCNLFSEIESY